MEGNLETNDFFEPYNKAFRKLTKMAINYGASEIGINIDNALQFIEKRNRFLWECEVFAQELGYKSLKTALKALGQIKSHKISDISNLPAIFHAVPNIWLSGKVDTRRSPGFKPLALSVALRKHRVIVPLLIEAWTLANGDESIQDEIVNSYLSRSADEFEKELYRYIYDLEEISLEEEFAEAAVTSEEADECYRMATDKDIFYGVVKKGSEENQ